MGQIGLGWSAPYFPMKTIEYTDLVNKIRELQPDISFDESLNRFRYPYDPGGRTGIMYKTKHVCNTSRGTLREEDTIGKPGVFEVPCTAQEALIDVGQIRDPQKYTGYMHQLTPELPTLWAEACSKMLNAEVGIIWLGGEQVQVQRIVGYTSSGELVHNIIVSTFTKKVDLPSTILRIGWRNVLRSIMQARVPNLHREALETAFGVELGVDKRAGKSFQEIVAAAR